MNNSSFLVLNTLSSIKHNIINQSKNTSYKIIKHLNPNDFALNQEIKRTIVIFQRHWKLYSLIKNNDLDVIEFHLNAKSLFSQCSSLLNHVQQLEEKITIVIDSLNNSSIKDEDIILLQSLMIETKLQLQTCTSALQSFSNELITHTSLIIKRYQAVVQSNALCDYHKELVLRIIGWFNVSFPESDEHINSTINEENELAHIKKQFNDLSTCSSQVCSISRKILQGIHSISLSELKILLEEYEFGQITSLPYIIHFKTKT